MATINSHEASPSTSRRSYEAYLSFRGVDTNKRFADHLYRALMRKGLSTFRDDDELERGEDIMPELQKAIEGSRVSIIVLSKNYASSRRCLEELVMILKCRSSGHLILPVFYDVDPSEVRTQTGSLKEAFMRHERRIEMEMGEQKEYLKGKVQEWRMALKEVANLAGFHLSQNIFEAYKSKIIQHVRVIVTEFVTINNRAHPGSHDGNYFCASCNMCVSGLEDERTRGKRSRDEMSSHVFSLDILQQHFGNKREDVAKSLGTVYSEIEAARGSSKRVFQLEGQTTQSTNREGISSHVFSLDILQPHFGSKREDVAKSLGISVSTLKRICRYHGIPRWPNRIRSSVSGLPNPYGEKNPLPTFNTLSTNGQTTMENEVGGQNLEPNECLPDSFDDPNFQNTRIGSISEFGKTPTFYDSLSGHCHDAEFCFSAVYSETEVAGDSSEWVFQLEGQTTQSIACANSNALVFPQRHIASEEVLNENGGSSEDRRDSLASQAEASFEGHVSESSNLTVLACSDAAAPNQPLATMPTVPNIIPHVTGGSSETFQLEKEMGGQIREPNEFLPDSFQDPSLCDAGNDSIVEIGKTPAFHDSFHGNHCDVEFCFSSVYNETGAAGGSSRWAFQLEGQTTQIPSYPIPDVLVSKPHIASIEVLSENMGRAEDRRILLPSQETSQKEAFLQGHVFESSNLTVPTFSDAAAPSQPLATILHTIPTIPPMVPRLTGGSSEFSGCPNLSGIVDPHPQITSTQILSENMRTLEDLGIFLVSQEPFMEGCGSGSINPTIPSCLDPAPSQQPMMPPSSLVDPHPQIASTQILCDNMGTSEALSIFLVSQEPFMKESGSGSNNQTIPSCLDPAPSQQPRMPPLIASQDTSSVRVKATYGRTTIAFKLSFASGIIQLKEEVSKRLWFELGNFDLKYKDADGDLVSIVCDDDVRDYLQLLTSLGNQVSKLFVS
ncbi:uncharacterized protein LOC131325669 isoform X2 [Rhododendron vialii]|uniref:uncharacterized protein LOC131325669 isoform X2 n=1 Tax=Rhododendron vialii TaxID=182163 RepID=UPI00265DA492|nr:uncharacterized protein LOC131325669 isoform X2 [Rhododendron vialii]